MLGLVTPCQFKTKHHRKSIGSLKIFAFYYIKHYIFWGISKTNELLNKSHLWIQIKSIDIVLPVQQLNTADWSCSSLQFMNLSLTWVNLLDLPNRLNQPPEKVMSTVLSLFFPSGGGDREGGGGAQFAGASGLDCGDVGWLTASPVLACQHALIWMFLFYCVFVCLFVCVCILRSVVYQDGFYGADIYVSIFFTGMTLHATPPSLWLLPCCICKSPNPTLHNRKWLPFSRASR